MGVGLFVCAAWAWALGAVGFIGVVGIVWSDFVWCRVVVYRRMRLPFPSLPVFLPPTVPSPACPLFPATPSALVVPLLLCFASPSLLRCFLPLRCVARRTPGPRPRGPQARHLSLLRRGTAEHLRTYEHRYGTLWHRTTCARMLTYILHARMLTYILHARMLTYILHARMLTYIHARIYIHTYYMHTYILTYNVIHAYIQHTYTCIHTCIHTLHTY